MCNCHHRLEVKVQQLEDEIAKEKQASQHIIATMVRTCTCTCICICVSAFLSASIYMYMYNFIHVYLHVHVCVQCMCGYVNAYSVVLCRILSL